MLHPQGYSPGPKFHCSDANGQAGQERAFQPSSVSCNPLARMRNALFSLIFTKVCGVGAHWHSAAAFKTRAGASAWVCARAGAAPLPGRHNGCAFPSRLDALLLQSLQY